MLLLQNGSNPLSTSLKRLTQQSLHLRLYSLHTPKFKYRLSAAYSAKQERLDLIRNSYFYDPPSTAPALPSPDIPLSKRKSLRPKSGQDAFFINTFPSTKTVSFGVIDGVGGWQDSGVDPAHFSHGLCEYMSKYAAEHTDTTDLKPAELLNLGYKAVLGDESIYAGGSTACVATASEDGTLTVANLGDSGYTHFSPLRLTNLSKPQQHEFNTPFQLSKIPGPMAKQLALFGGQHHGERPSDADVYMHEVKHGDVLVFATDGVWDNLAAEEVLGIVSREMVKRGGWVRSDGGGSGEVAVGKDLAKISTAPTATTKGRESEKNGMAEDVEISTVLARAVAREAKQASENSKRDGPFAKEVKRRFPYENYRGGKVDDICCIVGVVLQEGI